MSGGGGGGAGAGAVVRQGYLRKLKSMKRKYFVLRAEGPGCSARLEYYENEKKFRAGAPPRRALPLPTCYNITRRLDLKQRHVIALSMKEDQFCVVADGEEDLHGWLTDILKQHQSEDASEELLHPTQHVWQVNVQKKGLGATKNILGLYNLCLTDKTLSLFKIKSTNIVLGEQQYGAMDRIEYSLRNIRRCGDSECFFYMEVGRQTVTGAGELWMHTDDANIAQSMHSTIYHAMSNCGEDKEMLPYRLRSSSATEDPRKSSLPARRQTYSDSRGRAGLSLNEKGFCVGSCIKQCVCSTTFSIDESAAAIAPLASKNADENRPVNSQLTDQKMENVRHIKHHRTVSLPTGCTLFQEPLRIVHERTRSAPLTGDEVDCAIIEKAARHSSCRTVNGVDFVARKTQWSRRASTGTKMSKLSPAHAKNAPAIRSRCDSMPSRTCPPLEPERMPARPAGQHGAETPHDETDADWLRTPRIPEEPDYCDMHPNMPSVNHSRHSSIAEDAAGYLPMMPALSASSGSVSGTPSTDPRFSSYQLEPATSHLLEDSARPLRAYSVGSRPPPPAPPRLRAYSVGAPRRAARASPAPPAPARGSADDLMELDFSNNSPQTKVIVSRTPPAANFIPAKPRSNFDEYVDMSPRAGYMEMKPSEIIADAVQVSRASRPKSPPVQPSVASAPVATTPDGYVEMNYGKKTEAPTLPIAIVPKQAMSNSLTLDAQTPEEVKKKNRTPTPLGSQTLFPLSLESPASEEHQPPIADEFDEDSPHHPLTTLREISEEGRRSPELGSPPNYVSIVRTASQPIAAPNKLPCEEGEELSCNPTATKTWAGDKGPEKSPSAGPGEGPRLHYAALDLDRPAARVPAPPRLYTQIDFNRSEKLNATDSST